MKPAGQARPAYLLYQSFWKAVDWVFPPTCGGCGKMGVRWCDDCRSKTPRIGENACPRCGEPQPGREVCPSCAQNLPGFQQLRSYAIYQGPLRHAIHRLKYGKDIGLGEALSIHLIELYNQIRWNVDCVIPVPLSAKRLRQRGYNQANLLGRPLAYAIQRPFRTDMLIKKRETHTQVGLSGQERRQNVDGAYAADPGLVSGKSFLIVDDVATTGSTISACAKALCESGASAVYGLTLCRAALQADADDQPNLT